MSSVMQRSCRHLTLLPASLGACCGIREAWKWSSQDYTLHVLPLHHIHGVQNILNTALYNGAGVEFTPFDAGFCLERLSSGDITCFHAVPTVYFGDVLGTSDGGVLARVSQGFGKHVPEVLRVVAPNSAGTGL